MTELEKELRASKRRIEFLEKLIVSYTNAYGTPDEHLKASLGLSAVAKSIQARED